MATKSSLKKEYPKKSKGRSEKNSEDESWILEGIVAFLRSPTWTSPVLNFVEENCGEFQNSEENKFEYTEIHKKYQKLVENLLQCYMRELGLSESQFSKVCSKENSDIASLDGSFEYIWAADDFLLFKKLMLKNNLAVEMQAIHMLKQQISAFPEKDPNEFNDEDAQMFDKVLKKSKHSSLKSKRVQQQEEADLQMAIQFSKMEMERLNALAEEEKRLMEQAIRLSLESSVSATAGELGTEARPPAHNEGRIDHSALTQPVEIKDTNTKPPDGFSTSSLIKPLVYKEPEKKQDHKKNEGRESAEAKATDLPPLRTAPDVSNTDAATAWLNQAMKEITESPIHSVQNMSNHSSKSSIDPEELAKRKAYLQEQREKLLALKRKEREKELTEYKEQLQDNKSSAADTKPPDPEEERKLASRRAVAERLKKEVINKK